MILRAHKSARKRICQSGRTTLNYNYSKKGKLLSESPITKLLSQTIQKPQIISLAAGLTDYESLPCKECAELVEDITRDERDGRAALQYGTTQGLEGLREAVLKRFLAMESTRESKLALGPENVVLTGGSQQLLYILVELLVDDGDIVLVASPTYFVLLELLGTTGARVVGVDMDEEGMKPDELEKAIAAIEERGDLDRLKLVYVNSYFQNPTGRTCTLGRKRTIMKLLRPTRALIVEDAAYRELRYEGVDQPSMKSFDDEGRQIAYLGTFSKSFAPGIKTGYGILPGELAQKAVVLKGSHDFGSCNLAQHMLELAHRRGMIDLHVATLRKTYRAKRDEMQEALADEMSSLAEWATPTGGFYFWLELNDQVDTAANGELYKAAIEEGVLYVPGAYCLPGRAESPSNTMRLSFASAPMDKIRPGIERLAGALKQVTM